MYSDIRDIRQPGLSRAASIDFREEDNMFLSRVFPLAGHYFIARSAKYTVIDRSLMSAKESHWKKCKQLALKFTVWKHFEQLSFTF
jgi:hypothetical protein